MITELRRYSLLPGQSPAMHSRMREILMPLFATHAVPSPFAIWTPTDAAVDQVMTWMLRWPSFEARRAGWANLYPHWEKAKRERGGDEFVTRTTLTLVDPMPGLPFHFPSGEAPCETAWLVHASVGYGGDLASYCRSTLVTAARQAGATAVSACTMQFGPLPEALIWISWPDAATRSSGMTTLSPLLTFPLRSPDARDISGEGTITELTRAPYLTTW